MVRIKNTIKCIVVTVIMARLNSLEVVQWEQCEQGTKQTERGREMERLQIHTGALEALMGQVINCDVCAIGSC